MIKRILQCKTLQGKYPLEIPSETEPGKSYIVTIDPFANRSELHSCSCPSYHYRGRCKHQRIAHLSLCGWSELVDNGELTERHRSDMICPRCAGPTIYGIWDVEEDDT